MYRYLATIVLCCLFVACGKDSSPTAPSNTAVATVTVTDISVSVETAGGGFTYRGSHRINETGGGIGVLVTAITYSAGSGQSSNSTLATPANVARGGSLLRTFTLTDEGGLTAGATAFTVTVAYREEGGRTGTVSGSANIAQPAPPPAPSAPRSFTLFGVVSDLLSGRRIGGATVAAVDGTGARRTSTTDGNGYYSIAPLREGNVSLTTMASGYQALTRTVTLSADTNLALSLVANTQPTTPNLSCGAPAVVSCINGGGSGAPTARCDDGAWSCSTTASGTCSSHGGIACRVCPGPLCQ